MDKRITDSITRALYKAFPSVPISADPSFQDSQGAGFFVNLVSTLEAQRMGDIDLAVQIHQFDVIFDPDTADPDSACREMAPRLRRLFKLIPDIAGRLPFRGYDMTTQITGGILHCLFKVRADVAYRTPEAAVIEDYTIEIKEG